MIVVDLYAIVVLDVMIVEASYIMYIVKYVQNVHVTNVTRQEEDIVKIVYVGDWNVIIV
jgi:hypothetical protein